MTSELALQWLPCQVLGVIGSVLGLVGPVSVYCDWVSEMKVWSAICISVWQHVKLFEQIRPRNTLTFCWDQPTTNDRPDPTLPDPTQPNPTQPPPSLPLSLSLPTSPSLADGQDYRQTSSYREKKRQTSSKDRETTHL